MSQRENPPQDTCSFLCSPELIDRIDNIAHQNNVNREEAVRQLVYIGLGEVNPDASE